MAKFETGNPSSDSGQEITIKIPPILAKRAEFFAAENNTTVTNVVIEALDTFLREQAKR
jgi:hypothetical protein